MTRAAPSAPLSAEQTAALLPYGVLAEEIAAVLLENAAGQVSVPERTIVELPRGSLLTMPAADRRLAVVKVVTVHPGNAGTDLPTISGEVIVADAGDGRRLGVLHGGTVTVRRTAALSLLAARTLRPAGSSGSLLVVGAGAQGRGHAEALASEPGITRVVVASRTRSRADDLAAELAALDVSVSVVPPAGERFEAAVAEAALVVTATTSRSPVLVGGLRSDAVVCAVGAYRHDMAELAPEVVASAGTVVVDTLPGAKAEAGDLIAAAATGLWSWDEAVPLLELLGPAAGTGRASGPARHAVFKSVGHALYDLAAARVAFAG